LRRFTPPPILRQFQDHAKFKGSSATVKPVVIVDSGMDDVIQQTSILEFQTRSGGHDLHGGDLQFSWPSGPPDAVPLGGVQICNHIALIVFLIYSRLAFTLVCVSIVINTVKFVYRVSGFAYIPLLLRDGNISMCINSLGL
jgi:hypothetical protein